MTERMTILGWILLLACWRCARAQEVGGRVAETGSIPVQRVWHGNTLDFTLDGEALAGAVRFSLSVSALPLGEIRLAPRTRAFQYPSTEEDRESLDATVTAQAGTESLSQTFSIASRRGFR